MVTLASGKEFHSDNRLHCRCYFSSASYRCWWSDGPCWRPNRRNGADRGDYVIHWLDWPGWPDGKHRPDGKNRCDRCWRIHRTDWKHWAGWGQPDWNDWLHWQYW